MRRRIWLSPAMFATGVSLLVASGFASAGNNAQIKKGGVFRVGTTGASVQVDPQLANITTAWWLEYATAAKLYNYSPSGALVPEVASRFTVSKEGKRYTFIIRKGFRFSDGTPVTAASFKYAINRIANHDLASPGAAFITDQNAVDIVGARAVNAGRAGDVRGVQVRGNRLVVNLERADGRLLSVLTLPFFQATSTKLPLTHEVVNVTSIRDLPSAGPYAFSHNEANTLTSIRRNPYWTRGPGRQQPRNLSGLDIQWNLNEQTAFEMVQRGELDEGPLPAAEVQGVANQYGVNRTRFWVKPTSCVGSIPFNNSRGLFIDNAPMRKAVNWALDRTDYLGGAAPYTRTPWTHLLPPGFPGSITAKRLQPYATTSRIAKARELAAGHFKDGRIIVAYRSSGTIGPAQAEIVRRDLIRLGFDAANIEMKPYSGWPTGDWDLIVSIGWCYDLPDPANFLLGAFLPPGSEYRAKIEAADHLTRNARLKALGKLDLEIAKKVAPVAAMHSYNNRYFFSGRVDPRSLRYHFVYQDWSIPALALK